MKSFYIRQAGDPIASWQSIFSDPAMLISPSMTLKKIAMIDHVLQSRDERLIRPGYMRGL
jgi:hypothetical protein